MNVCRGSSPVERRPEKAGVASSILAPGTTQSCKSFFAEKINLSIRLKCSRSIAFHSFKSEFSDLFCEQGSRLVIRTITNKLLEPGAESLQEELEELRTLAVGRLTQLRGLLATPGRIQSG